MRATSKAVGFRLDVLRISESVPNDVSLNFAQLCILGVSIILATLLTLFFLISAGMGGFGLGNVIGWSSPASRFYKNITVTDAEWDHISSIVCIGALFAQLFVALTLPAVGPKILMIILAPIFSGFWIMIGLVESFVPLLIARFCTGFCGGAFCVIAPTYVGEISDRQGPYD